jgi:hypothetical protein
VAEGGIFVRAGDGLTLLRPKAYESEDLLQALLADYPQVIAGVSTDDGDSRSLVLVDREISVPGTGFSLDHLFLDSDGIPVLVEVKRASDTRIRREVVGQMLDYAASAATNWPIASLRDTLEARVAAAGRDIDDYLSPVAGATSRASGSGSRRTSPLAGYG